jgi:hypothetical protein
MRYRVLKAVLLMLCCSACLLLRSQQPANTKPVSLGAEVAAPDSSQPLKAKDTATQPGKVVHSPKIALRRSAMLPGWGQIYNKQYWKLPIVYGGLGITTGVFVYNLKWYKKTRFAFNAKSSNNAVDIANIDPKLRDLDVNNLSFYRRQFRQGVDYSVLFFVAAWGLNVLDAVVFAHLKDFDVSNDLGLHIKQGYSELAQTNGVSLVVDLNRRKNIKPLVIIP